MSTLQKILLPFGLILLPIASLFYMLAPAKRTAKPVDPKAMRSDGSDIQKVRWQNLRELDFSTGKATDKLMSTLEKPLKIPGFIVPLEVSDRMVQRFLLVPTRGACIHTPPPPPNQMIYVYLSEGGVPAKEKTAPVWVHGMLSIETEQTKWGSVGFSMDAYKVEPFQGGY